MSNEYLQRVHKYILQKFPAYNSTIAFQQDKLIFVVPDGEIFQPYYEKVFQDLNACITQVRKREIDINIKVWSKYQERDFIILK
ncbi:hypothetical protein ACFFGT_03135 [Mucilaginibacter angelicae]|uniref:DUF721 domain-containing protein n=1 Tax=Mucilaginibacter angelicae TaxID=869718 RepID=A0ABV6L0E2_9SPHI